MPIMDGMGAMKYLRLKPGRFIQRLCSLLTLEERITIASAVALNLLVLASLKIGLAWDIFGLNILITSVIFGVAIFHRHVGRTWMQIFRDWYVPVFLIAIYLENRRLVPLINPHDLDTLLISLDRLLFLGSDPTLLMERITCPALSEFLQLAYTSFYFLPFSLCVIIYLKQGDRTEFHIAASTILAGFYLSYLGYYLAPAIGPRFTLDHVQTVPLSGVFLFDALRSALDQVEGVMRDCCPSGHTAISLMSVLLAGRYAPRFFPAACIWSALIVFSSVYLRYHYVVDLAAGAVLGCLVYRFAPGIAARLIRKRDS
jgi:membrane-associated phospholipid phosphatase